MSARYVVQTYSNADGWQCSKYMADTVEIARVLEAMLVQSATAWMPSDTKRETRIFDTVGNRIVGE